MLEISGGAERLARTMIRVLGKQNTHWALMIVGYICGIPVFFQVGIVLLMPLLFCVAVESGMSLITLGIPMIIGLLTVHCMVPPHPAATAVAVALHADIGKVILYGLIVGFPAAAIAGPIFGKLIGKGMSKDEALNNMNVKTVEGLYTLDAIYDILKQKKVEVRSINLLYDVVYNGKKVDNLLKEISN